jgi:APA family basic amino acid/polyamine antiporter
MHATESPGLLRSLGLHEAIALVVGTILGTGIFLKAAVMSQYVGAALWVLAAWAAAGLLSLCGAVVYAELGARFPHAGGEYVYLRQAYGPFVAFLYGWQRFWIGGPGSIAALGVGAATFLDGVVSMSTPGRTAVALGLIAIFSLLNCLSVAFGGKLQSLLTALKVLLALAFTSALFGLAPSGHLAQAAGGWPGFSAFGAAMLAALWAFDGWNNLPMAAGEIRNAQDLLPKALGGGILIVILVYLLINLAYFHALPFAEVLNANSTLHPDQPPVATKAAMTVFGSSGATILSGVLVLSALGAMNGSILTDARVPYAMAKDRLFFAPLARVSGRTRVPVTSIAAQGVISCVLALSGTFDQLTDYVVFASWIFYALAASAVIVFRVRDGAPATYRAPFYPWLPLVFVGASLLLMANTVITSPKPSLIGLALIAMGVPVFAVQRLRLSPTVPSGGGKR